MKKFIFAIVLASITACYKDPINVEIIKVIEKEEIEIIEKEVVKDVIKEVEKEVAGEPTNNNQPKSEETISFFLEEQTPITIANKGANDKYINMKAFGNDFYILVETTNGSNKTYSVQKLDWATSTLTPVIENLTIAPSDIVITDRHIFIGNNSFMNGYDKNTKQLDVDFRAYQVNTLLTAAVRDGKFMVVSPNKILFYDYSKVIKANRGQHGFYGSASLNTSTRHRNQADQVNAQHSLLIRGNELYHATRNYQPKNVIRIYEFKADGTLDNQSKDREILFGTPYNLYHMQFFKDELFSGLGENGFGRIDTEGKGSIRQRITTFNGQPINVKGLVATTDKLYALDELSGNILVYTAKNIVFKKY